MPDSKNPHHEAGASTNRLQRGRIGVDDLALDGADALSAHMRAAGQPLDVAMRDWDDLVSAVKTRLRLTVGERMVEAAELPLQGHDAAQRIRSDVLECVAALDHLHTTLTHELARRGQLELEVFDAHAELAQARAELVGIQAGERRARHQAAHDSLTRLPNGGHFRERLAHALTQVGKQHQTLAVMYLDLDDFKLINDLHGHNAGDELLRIVAARLTRAVRTEDVVSRLGGDEFACMFGGFPGREQLSQLACKLFDAISAPFQIGKLKLTVRPSIGIAIGPADGVTAETLLGAADAAMYSAKRNQSGHAFADQSIDMTVSQSEDLVGFVDDPLRACTSDVNTVTHE